MTAQLANKPPGSKWMQGPACVHLEHQNLHTRRGYNKFILFTSCEISTTYVKIGVEKAYFQCNQVSKSIRYKLYLRVVLKRLKLKS